MRKVQDPEAYKRSRISRASSLGALVLAIATLVCVAVDQDLARSALPGSLAALCITLMRISHGIRYWMEPNLALVDKESRFAWTGLSLAALSLPLALTSVFVESLTYPVIGLEVVAVILSLISAYYANRVRHQYWHESDQAADSETPATLKK